MELVPVAFPIDLPTVTGPLPPATKFRLWTAVRATVFVIPPPLLKTSMSPLVAPVTDNIPLTPLRLLVFLLPILNMVGLFDCSMMVPPEPVPLPFALSADVTTNVPEPDPPADREMNSPSRLVPAKTPMPIGLTIKLPPVEKNTPLSVSAPLPPLANSENCPAAVPIVAV